MRRSHPWTPYFSHSALPDAVQSTSAMTTFWESANSSASLSQSGFIDLQWPHQGARNLTKADLPASAPSQLSMSSSSAPCAVATAPTATSSRSAAIPHPWVSRGFSLPKKAKVSNGGEHEAVQQLAYPWFQPALCGSRRLKAQATARLAGHSPRVCFHTPVESKLAARRLSEARSVALRVAHCPLSTTFNWRQLHSLLSPTPQRANAAP